MLTEGELATTSSSGVRAEPEPSPRDGGSPWYVRLGGSFAAQAGASALLVATLVHLRYAYMAGDRDHLVLSPLGLRWAHPDWFVNDWAMANAPQPHYLFDFYTWLGERTGTLAGLYLLYWLAAMAVWGIATAILARAWAPGNVWFALMTVTVLATVAPLALYGSGGTLFATGLPGVLGGALVYLTAAALLAGDHRVASVAGVAAAIAHVQQGAITMVLCAMVAALVWSRERRIDWRLVGAAAASLAIVLVGLRIRPVAGHLEDFADACRVLIPYHCEASTWGRDTMLAGAALIGLALATVAYVARADRGRWLLVVALPAAGMLGATAADRWNVPGLGVLVQGLNVYRLAVILLPLAVWGALVPLLGDLTVRRRLGWLAVSVVLGIAALTDPGWGLQAGSVLAGGPWMVAFGCLYVLGVAALVHPRLRPYSRRMWRVCMAGLIVTALLSAAAGGVLRLRPFDPRFFPDDDLTRWGAEVQAAVPPGGVLVVPPEAVQLRIATKRAVMVDCKYGPYGGEPWREFKQRLESVGGISQCLTTEPAYDRLTAEQLTAAASRYGAGYVVIHSENAAQAAALEAAGAQRLVAATGTAGYVLLRLVDTG
jgi:hypothetical protein